MGWIAWIAVGAVAGFLASIIVGSREGLLMMIAVGIVGGLVGGFVATNLLHVGSVNSFNLESILIATLGAVAVLVVMRMATRPRGINRLWRR
jgi:uncharacterized membrane protein YeaQ/YmgE (transglycosylase-associated protein family)